MSSPIFRDDSACPCCGHNKTQLPTWGLRLTFDEGDTMENNKRLARQWAERINSTPKILFTEEHRAAAEFILANTKPSTMQGVKWDDHKHFLTGASHKDGDDEVMLGVDGYGDVITLPLNGQPAMYSYTPGDLTPNGKRYKLREVTVSSGENVGPDQQDHPRVLSTLEDYELADVRRRVLRWGWTK